MATFGYIGSTYSTSTFDLNGFIALVCRVQASGTGDVSKLTAYFGNQGTGHAATVVRACMWTDTAGNPTTGAAYAIGSEVNVSDNAAAADVDLPFASAPSVTSGSYYWLGWFTNSTGVGLQLGYNDGYGSYPLKYREDFSYPSLPNEPNSNLANPAVMRIYATIPDPPPGFVGLTVTRTLAG